MKILVDYLGSGKIYKYPGKPAVVLTIFNFSDINNLIIPFFENNPLLPYPAPPYPLSGAALRRVGVVLGRGLGVKLIDYLVHPVPWVKVAKLINEGSHLTIEGLNLIREIKSGMNTGRDNNNI